MNSNPPERAQPQDESGARQRSAFVIARTEALRQRAQLALRDIKLQPQSWNESLASSGLDMQKALLATTPVSQSGADMQASLRSVLLDAAYQVK